MRGVGKVKQTSSPESGCGGPEKRLTRRCSDSKSEFALPSSGIEESCPRMRRELFTGYTCTTFGSADVDETILVPFINKVCLLQLARQSTSILYQGKHSPGQSERGNCESPIRKLTLTCAANSLVSAISVLDAQLEEWRKLLPAWMQWEDQAAYLEANNLSELRGRYCQLKLLINLPVLPAAISTVADHSPLDEPAAQSSPDPPRDVLEDLDILTLSASERGIRIVFDELEQAAQRRNRSPAFSTATELQRYDCRLQCNLVFADVRT